MATHEAYVIASYCIAALTVAVMIAWVLLDARGRRRDLERLEAQGIRRRSARPGGGA